MKLLLAANISAVLRTPVAFYDDRMVRLTYQLRDANGNVRVQTKGARVDITASLAGYTPESTQCGTSGVTDASKYYLGQCELSLPSAWFIREADANVTISAVLRHTGLPLPVATATLSDRVLLRRQPAWVGALEKQFNNGTSFATLPAFSMLAGEEFDVQIYAHTNGYPLLTFAVWLYYPPSQFELKSFVQNPIFERVKQTPGGRDNEVLRFDVVGHSGQGFDDEATSTSLWLLNATMRVLSDAPAATYNMSIYTSRLINTGTFAFVKDSWGSVFDARDSANRQGQLIVRPMAEHGIFSYTQSAQLANFALVTGEPQSSVIVAVATTDSKSHESVKKVSNPVCELLAPAADVIVLQGCTVHLTPNQSASRDVSVEVTHDDFSTRLVLGVHTPQAIDVSVADPVLNRIDGVNCRGRAMYQRTRALVEADGLDVSPLVTFGVSNPSVLDIVSQSDGLIQGLAVGEARVFLEGRGLAFRSAKVNVSDSGVLVSALVSRLVTDLVWDSPPDSMVLPTGFTASVLLKHVLQAEEAEGTIFTRVVWSDGSAQDVGTGLVSDEDALNVTTLTSSLKLMPPSNSEKMWRARVATGAEAECGDLLAVELSMCGTPVPGGTTLVPVCSTLAPSRSMGVCVQEVSQAIVQRLQNESEHAWALTSIEDITHRKLSFTQHVRMPTRARTRIHALTANIPSHAHAEAHKHMHTRRLNEDGDYIVRDNDNTIATHSRARMHVMCGRCR